MQQIIQHNEQRMAEWRDRYTERDLALNDTIAMERADRQKEVKAAVEEERRAFEARLEAMDQRLSERINKGAERSQALSEAWPSAIPERR